MIFKFRYVLVFIVSLITHGSLLSQNQITPNPHGGWLIYAGDNKINERVGVHSEAQFRNFLLSNTIHQLLLRPGINYYMSSTSMLSAGYGFIHTHPSNQKVLGVRTLEHRIWQQLILRQPVGEVSIEHRYRLEQRFINDLDANSSIFDNRIRYRFQAMIPIHAVIPSLQGVFINSYNEFFANLGRGTSAEIFDRNRLYFALGYQVSSQMNFQLGYLKQLVNMPSNSTFEVNHNLQISVFYNVDLESMKKTSN